MITAHSGHFLYPDSLQLLTSSSSLSHIELDATKSPLALLAQTCSQIGKPDPLSTTNPPNHSEDSEGLKISNISFYSKSAEKKDSDPPPEGQCALRTQSVTCRPFAVCSPKTQDEDEKNDRISDKVKGETSERSKSTGSEINTKTRRDSDRNPSSSVTFSTPPSLGLDMPLFPTLPLPAFPRSCAGFPQPVLPALNSKASIISAGPCGDPYCLGYHCAASLKPTFPLLYPSPALPSAFTMFPHGLLHPHEPQSHVFNGVTATSSEASLPSSVCSHTHAALRSPQHTLGLGTRYHPYFKSPVPTSLNSYYSLHELYGQRLHLGP